MNWEWPQLAVAGLSIASLGMMLGLHGKPRTGENNFIVSLISNGILIWLLYMGGFWTTK